MLQDTFFNFCLERARPIDIKEVTDAKVADWAKLFLEVKGVKCNSSRPLAMNQ